LHATENYAYGVKHSIAEPGFAGKIPAGDKEKLDKAIADTMHWLETNQVGRCCCVWAGGGGKGRECACAWVCVVGWGERGGLSEWCVPAASSSAFNTFLTLFKCNPCPWCVCVCVCVRQLAEVDEFKHQQQELEGLCSPIISRAYQAGGQGPVPMDEEEKARGAGRPAGAGAGDEPPPLVEEVD
jgi:hypothetical protein